MATKDECKYGQDLAAMLRGYGIDATFAKEGRGKTAVCCINFSAYPEMQVKVATDLSVRYRCKGRDVETYFYSDEALSTIRRVIRRIEKLRAN